MASLTPCVYPLIPVTASYIGGRAEGSRRKAFFLSVLYSAGIATTYAAIGTLLTVVHKSMGDIARSYGVSLGIGVICVLFAMMLFDRLAIPVPAALQNLQAKHQQKSGLFGAYFAGMIFGTVASPCLAPLVGVISIEVAKTNNIPYAASLLFAFGIGLGLLFILVGTFAGLVTSLPRAGQWMERIKNGFGWAMLAIAAWYFFAAGRLYAESHLVARAEPAALPTVRLAAEVSPDKPVEVGDEHPEIVWAGPEGREERLSQFRGKKAVLIILWASWCKNCPAEVPRANRLQQRFARELKVLGINELDAPAVARRWMEKYGVQYDCLLDPEQEMMTAYGIFSIPYNVVVGKDGLVKYAGAALPKEEELAELLRR